MERLVTEREGVRFFFAEFVEEDVAAVVGVSVVIWTVDVGIDICVAASETIVR